MERLIGKPGLVQEQLMPEIKSQVMLCFSAVSEKLKLSKACFEIFGFDFLCDSDCKLWLLEINSNPCLELPSPWLEKLVPRMINDALKLTID